MNSATLEELLKLSFYREASGMYTAIPCRITNIPNSLSDLRVDVEPVIQQQYADGSFEEHTQILGVPVVFPTGRTSMLSFPLFVGDTVLCVFSQSSMDNFKQGSGTPQRASDARRMDSRDAIAIPGLYPFGKSLNRAAVRSWPHSTADMVVAHNIATGTEVELRMKPNGDIIINTNQDAFVNSKNATVTVQEKVEVVCTDFVLNASNSISITAGSSMTISSPVTNWTGNILQTGDYTQTGTYTLDGININLHKHKDVTPGTGTSGVSTN
jgi:hypothetical protein